MAKGEVTDVKGRVGKRTERRVDRVTNREEREREDGEPSTAGQGRGRTEYRRQTQKMKAE